MTNRVFGASAPRTPPESFAQDTGASRIKRAWLVARFVRQEPVRCKDFQERFGRPGRTFCCEVAALRALGIHRACELVYSPKVKPEPGGAAQ